MSFKIPEFMVLDNQSGTDTWKNEFQLLFDKCLELRGTLDQMAYCRSEDKDQMKQLVRQRRRIVKARGIFRRVKDQVEGKLTLRVDKYGHPHVELLCGEWEIFLGGMGIDCNCPDEGRDFGICKHKMAMIMLVNEVTQVD